MKEAWISIMVYKSYMHQDWNCFQIHEVKQTIEAGSRASSYQLEKGSLGSFLVNRAVFSRLEILQLGIMWPTFWRKRLIYYQSQTSSILFFPE